MKDNWELTKLFRFETTETAKTSDHSNYKIPLHPNINQLDKQVFNEIITSILIKYTNALEHGQIIGGLEFLDFHFNKTKFLIINRNKFQDRFLLFVKYYILSKPYMTKEVQEEHTYNDEFVKNWILKKEGRMRRRIYMPWILLFLLLILAGVLFGEEYKQLFLGLILGLVSGLLSQLINDIRPQKN